MLFRRIAKKTLLYTQPVSFHSVFLPGKRIKEAFSQKNMFIPFAVAEIVTGTEFQGENCSFPTARKTYEILLSVFFMETFYLT
jgi:hypothetical protein